ncbi:MAG: hypothetical protein Q4E50_07135 [Tissierellia bacterium]|nr:hypothetical protein [Tissierellia bacterium]
MKAFQDSDKNLVIADQTVLQLSVSPSRILIKKSFTPCQIPFIPSINPDHKLDRKVVMAVQELVQLSDSPCHKLTKKSFIPIQIVIVDSLIVFHREITPSLNQSHLFQRRTMAPTTAAIAIGTIPIDETTAVIAEL